MLANVSCARRKILRWTLTLRAVANVVQRPAIKRSCKHGFDVILLGEPMKEIARLLPKNMLSFRGHPAEIDADSAIQHVERTTREETVLG